MKEKRYSHISRSDGLKLSVLRTEPDNSEDIKGIVQLVHGMNEYKERYIPFIKFLTDNGYLCVIHDHRGHGASVKSPDDLGYMYEGGYEALIEDTHEITLEIKTYAKEITGKDNLPFILFGHSMGSMVVRCYIRKYDADIDKLIVCGCPSAQSGMKPGLALINIFTKIKGERKRPVFVANLVMGSYEKRFKKEGLPHSWVNSNPEQVKKYNADPLCNYIFTLNGFGNLVRLTILTYTNGGYAMNKPDLPIRFFSGEDDPCAVSEKAFNQAMGLLKKQGYKDVDGIMYPNLRHEILNEDAKDMVYEDMLNFIK
ncbi:MAG: alpha/beta fold hydrolase [Lachnospiraceae bacterium]|nr:alpha/beta fold hydrolase [Lachnospiraceae bacterium]